MKTSPPRKKVSTVTSLFAKPEEGNVAHTGIAFLNSYEEQAMEFLKNEGKYSGVSTGYESLDELLGSFIPGEVLTIGGDTGHGKSLLAMNIAQRVYDKTQKPVLFINLELTVEQAVQRFYNLSGKEHDYAGIMVQTSTDVNYKDVDRLMADAKAAGACLVVVDHLHFFDDSIGDNAASAITRVMKNFKKCAVKHELPLIVLSHVTPQTRVTSHGLETIRPDLHSFKGSKSIEQLSDMVGFVFRDAKDTKKVDFYLRKNRSRPLNPEPVELTQSGWKLMDTSWLPTNLPPLGA